MILGIATNPFSPNVSKHLLAEANRLTIPTRIIDLPTLTVTFDGKNKARVYDKDGEIRINYLAPYLLFGFPLAAHAFHIFCKTAYSQNPVEGVMIADDKAATAEKLNQAGIPQVSTTLCNSDFESVLNAAKQLAFPVVLKRTHGAEGYWVRRAFDESSLKRAFEEVLTEGDGVLLLQPLIVESQGVSIRAIITGEEILAVTKRFAKKGEWRSNIAGGANQTPIDLTTTEKEMALAAAKTIGLRHAGVDLLRTSRGPVILEINSCPDFTSMLPYFQENLTEIVLKASMNYV